MAPIDIILSIIKRHAREAHQDVLDAKDNSTFDFDRGREEAYKGLIEEFEEFKKLFN